MAFNVITDIYDAEEKADQLRRSAKKEAGELVERSKQRALQNAHHQLDQIKDELRQAYEAAELEVNGEIARQRAENQLHAEALCIAAAEKLDLAAERILERTVKQYGDR